MNNNNNDYRLGKRTVYAVLIGFMAATTAGCLLLGFLIGRG